MQTNWRMRAKAWVPPAIVQLYRRRRGDPRASPQFTLPVRTLAQLFPSSQAQAVQIPVALVGRGDEWAVPAAELLAIAALCATIQPRRVFEIGTYTGESTRVIAYNTPSDTRITTLDLTPEEFARRTGRQPHFVVGSAFHGTAEAVKIEQHVVGERGFDFAPYRNHYDLVFVDADHSYNAVRADSNQAFRLLRPGGVVLWDDYTWTEQHPECVGVTRAVNELAATRPIYRVAGTRLAVTIVD